jgi:cyclin D6
MFDAVTIRRMERVVLGALEWRARSVTPLAFLGFFLSACFPPPRHPPLLDAVKARAVDILIRAQPGTCQCGRQKQRTFRRQIHLNCCSVFGFAEVKMAEYPPSVVAASALLSAASEVAGAHLPAFQAGVAACPFVNSVSMITFPFFH